MICFQVDRIIDCDFKEEEKAAVMVHDDGFFEIPVKFLGNVHPGDIVCIITEHDIKRSILLSVREQSKRIEEK